MGDDDVTDRMAEMLSISKTDVEMCMNKTNVNISKCIWQKHIS